MTDVEGFRAKIEAAKIAGTEAVNRVFWEDVSRNLEAWAIMNIWRGSEILHSGISELNSNHYLSSAILARALIELASVMITEANNMLATIKNLPQQHKNQIVMVDGLEEIILRLLWGTRQPNTPEYLIQKNILGYLKKLSENPHASDLLGTYEYLCEAAHPNVVGYARFQNSTGMSNGKEIIINMSSDIPVVESQARIKLLEHILWAFGWSSVCLRNGFHIIQESIVEIDKHFHFGRKADSS